jgi:hypothetical protein
MKPESWDVQVFNDVSRVECRELKAKALGVTCLNAGCGRP